MHGTFVEFQRRFNSSKTRGTVDREKHGGRDFVKAKRTLYCVQKDVTLHCAALSAIEAGV